MLDSAKAGTHREGAGGASIQKSSLVSVVSRVCDGSDKWALALVSLPRCQPLPLPHWAVMFEGLPPSARCPWCPGLSWQETFLLSDLYQISILSQHPIAFGSDTNQLCGLEQTI